MQNPPEHSGCSIIESEIGFWIVKSDENAILSIDFSKERSDLENGENEISLLAKKQLQEYFNKERTTFDLPLAMEGYSEFYQKVWKALATVEFGITKSYTDLSLMVNNPKAVRAVGMANGKNPFPIVIPCHRIIGSDNSLTGYASGIDVKRWLLEHEGVFARQTSLF